MQKRLNEDVFKSVVASTPLVSIDLIVKNAQQQVLLGLRNNRPAKNYWFVPGGRILKDETFTEAFLRLTTVELGIEMALSQAIFLGAFEHFYQDNFSDSRFSTHYVVLGYQINLNIALSALPLEQHQRYQWWGTDALLASDLVHANTKAYFNRTK